jgi:hypothetical protein
MAEDSKHEQLLEPEIILTVNQRVIGSDSYNWKQKITSM